LKQILVVIAESNSPPTCKPKFTDLYKNWGIRKWKFWKTWKNEELNSSWENKGELGKIEKTK